MSFVQSSKRKVYDQPYLYHRMSLNLLLYRRTYIRIRVYAFVKLPTVYLIRGQNNLIIIASRRAAVSNIICPHVCTRVRTCAHTLIGIRLSTAFSFSFSLFFFLFNLSPSNNVASLFLENSLNRSKRVSLLSKKEFNGRHGGRFIHKTELGNITLNQIWKTSFLGTPVLQSDPSPYFYHQLLNLLGYLLRQTLYISRFVSFAFNPKRGPRPKTRGCCDDAAFIQGLFE